MKKEKGGQWFGVSFRKRYFKDQVLPFAGPY